MRTSQLAYILSLALVFTSFGLVQRASGATTQPAKTYKVRINRPEKVGQTYLLTASCTSKGYLKQSDAEDEPSYRSDTFEIKAVRTVLKVDANGTPVSSMMTCKDCSATRRRGESRSTSSLAPGTTVSVTYDSKHVDTRAEDPNVTLPSAVKGMLPLAMCLPPGNGIDLENWFSSEKPRRVGESWAINAETIRKRLESNPPDAVQKALKVSGKVTLTSIAKVEGIECMILRGNLAIKLPRPVSMKSKTVEKQDFVLAITMALPLDESIPVVSRRMTITIGSLRKFPRSDGTESRQEYSNEETLSVRSVPLGK